MSTRENIRLIARSSFFSPQYLENKSELHQLFKYTFEPRHAKMCLREIDDVTRYDVLKSDVNISRIFQYKHVGDLFIERREKSILQHYLESSR